MKEQHFSCQIGGCGQRFASKSEKDRHRAEAHGAKPKGFRSRHARRMKPPMADMDRDDVCDLVEAMDLPDGAHWQMIEDLSGLEPGDFA